MTWSSCSSWGRLNDESMCRWGALWTVSSQKNECLYTVTVCCMLTAHQTFTSRCVLTLLLLLLLLLLYYYYYYPCNHLYAGYLQLYTWNKPCFKVYSVAAFMHLQFVLHVMLFHPWNMLYTFTLALSIACVQCPIWLFFVVYCHYHYYYCVVVIIIIISCHRPYLPGTALEPKVILTAQASSFWLQYCPYYVWCFKEGCFCIAAIECFPGMASIFFL